MYEMAAHRPAFKAFVRFIVLILFNHIFILMFSTASEIFQKIIVICY